MRCTIFVMAFLPCERCGHGLYLFVRKKCNKVKKNPKWLFYFVFLVKYYFLGGNVHEGKVLLENIGRKIKMIDILW